MDLSHIIYKDREVVSVFDNIEAATVEVLRLQKEFPRSDIERENWYTNHQFDVYRH